MAAYEKAGESDEWYTPEYILSAIGCVFDLDVAAPKEGPRYVKCESYFCDGSLEKEWKGLVWMNPPFGNQKQKRKWLNKFFNHGNGIALMPDRTSAPWWQEAAIRADVITFVDGKIKFERPDGTIGESPGTGTCLFASGARASRLLVAAKLGFTVKIKDM